MIGHRVTHRRYVPHSDAHYAGGLVDGAYGLGMFGDVATDLCIRTDGDEGLFAGYEEVQFHAPVRGGDVVEASAEVVAVGRRSRRVAFTLHVVGRGDPEPARPGRARVLTPAVLATTAVGTVVVPEPTRREE